MKEAPKEGTLDYQVIHEKKDDDVTVKTTRMASNHVTHVLPDKAETSANEMGLNGGDANVVMTSEKEDDGVIGL